ncbi:MAG: hypothetical protein H0X29_12005 [Parachlamydiaceae bacterium]|nr:hypothetical protein [Parachlamydiaceae bacterium]
MQYHWFALISVIIFALVHICAKFAYKLDGIIHGKLLSAGGGVAIAYVFIDLLPKLGESDQIVEKSILPIFPYFEKHVYLMALAGFLLFFIVGQSRSYLEGNGRFWLSLLSYALFNFLVGYAVVDKNDLEVQPLALFTIAIALHYFINDFTLTKEHGLIYEKLGKWLLIASLFFGWFAGLWIKLPEAAVALVSAFIGGGVIMNVTRHELPQDSPHSLGAFLLASFVYAFILLTIGVH